jgi:hypothetical protein
MLKDFLSPKYRKLAYGILLAAGLAIGSTAAGFLAVGATLPVWLKAAFAVHSFISTAGFGLARGNVTPESPSEPF